ncbi:MAG TPA: hypothetical protein HPQ03_07975 [Deltaproteobacteria bacterium]|nr:hypothetical protein [Deltaproteobacteria bacterium]
MSDLKSRKSFYVDCRLLSAALLLLIIILPGSAFSQKRSHSVFFEGTDYELHVYRISGELPGKTLLLIGGIQGDEPGGFLAVDQYADISLAKGNLIVVPRANFQSIVLKRRKINEDMNRKFAEDRMKNYETKIVSILKRLVQESDCLLNLHDGSGFFSNSWEGPNRNPMRFGQSIIVDANTFQNPKTGEVFQIGEIARSVVDQMNKHIKNPQYHFHFNNHRTHEAASQHKEQRKSATYYALYTCGIPAFGIETSKSLSLELKVRHHNLAIKEFMKRFEIIPETPGINLDPPKLDYLVIAVNNALPVVVRNQQTLFVEPGDMVRISHIEANYERGLTADLEKYGTISDMRKQFPITRPTRVVVRKDYHSFGSVFIALNGGEKKQAVPAMAASVSKHPEVLPKLKDFKIRINGKERSYASYDRATIRKGDLLEILDVTAHHGDPSDWVVNFKGFVGDRRNNTGEDRGYVIRTDKDLWQRYSLHQKGRSYQIVVTHEDRTLGKLYLDIEDAMPEKIQ